MINELKSRIANLEAKHPTAPAWWCAPLLEVRTDENGADLPEDAAKVRAAIAECERTAPGYNGIKVVVVHLDSTPLPGETDKLCQKVTS